MLGLLRQARRLRGPAPGLIPAAMDEFRCEGSTPARRAIDPRASLLATARVDARATTTKSPVSTISSAWKLKSSKASDQSRRNTRNSAGPCAV